MSHKAYKSDLLLLLAAAIWGFGFVAQRKGMEYIPPFLFNGIRFALGSIVILPFIFKNIKTTSVRKQYQFKKLKHILGFIGIGFVLFLAASFQQIGIIYTTAGNAGFITGLYVVIVPILGLSFGNRTKLDTWIGALLATTGRYLLTVTEIYRISKGDLLVLISAFFWAGHFHILGWLSPKFRSSTIACTQYIICSSLCFIISFFIEEFDFEKVKLAIIPILYTGILSVGIAYSLQIVAQKNAPPAHTAIILSLEAVFAILAGWLILNESLTTRKMLGCFLMFIAMLISLLNFCTFFITLPKNILTNIKTEHNK